MEKLRKTAWVCAITAVICEAIPAVTGSRTLAVAGAAIGIAAIFVLTLSLLGMLELQHRAEVKRQQKKKSGKQKAARKRPAKTAEASKITKTAGKTPPARQRNAG